MILIASDRELLMWKRGKRDLLKNKKIYIVI